MREKGEHVFAIQGRLAEVEKMCVLPPFSKLLSAVHPNLTLRVASVAAQ
jgi:hypothetical protein